MNPGTAEGEKHITVYLFKSYPVLVGVMAVSCLTRALSYLTISQPALLRSQVNILYHNTLMTTLQAVNV